EDTFYVGFKQNNNNFLPVGLDKNTNSSNKIFYKVDGMWNQNTVINGSLIIRPVFGKTDYVLTSISEIEIESSLNIYPNPSNGKFYLSEAADIIVVLNSEGKKIMNLKSTSEINLKNYPKGNYIIIIQTNSFVITKKVILN
ncbi:MAG: T9SS type A sorting domain-containing protein, partial [Bacteroidota bacterium]|nr:T9SS type A sorting domain-containing protein [Bacteroidota bacterium]